MVNIGDNQGLTGQVTLSICPVAKQVRFLMNTFVEIAVYDEVKSMAHQGMADAFSEIKRIESLMSRFLDESEISLINRSAGQPKPVRVSPDVIYVLKEAIKFSRLTNGAFDPTIASLVNLWSSFSRLGKSPGISDLNGILPLVNWQAIEIDEIKQTVRLALPGMALDMGGIAKGYAIDRVVAILKSMGIRNALIDIGGNIYALGNEPSGRGWDIGIRHPLIETQIIGRINLHGEAISTSASYERFYDVGSKKLSHIINPKTGIPVSNNLLSVSVISRSAILGDALSTAVFALGPDAGIDLVNKFSDLDILMVCRDDNQSEHRSDRDSELKIICSRGLENRITFGLEQRFRRY